MNEQNISLVLVRNTVLSQPVVLQQGAEPFRTRAVPGARYLLAQGDKGTAPLAIEAKRSGNNLVLGVPGEGEPRLIIEDFYLHTGEVGGLDAEGGYHTYIHADDNDDRDASELNADESAFLMLRTESSNIGTLTLPDSAAMNFLKAAGAFAGLLALGGLVLAMQNQQSGRDKALPPPAIQNASHEDPALTGVMFSGDVTNNPTPLLSGNGSNPGHLIEIYANGVLIGNCVVDDNGKWAFMPSALEHGNYIFTAVEHNGKGKFSPHSALFELEIDLIPPDVTLERVTDVVAGGVNGELPSDDTGLTNDARPRLSGTAEAGSLIVIYDGEAAIGSTIADAATGVWSWQYVGADRFTDGAHTLSVTATDAVGNTSERTEIFIITVDTAIKRPVIASVTDAVDGGTTGTINNDGTGLTNDAQPLFTGSAEAGSLVTIYNGTSVIGSALADAVTGVWSWQYSGEERFGEGAHVLTVKAVDAAGNTSALSDSFTLTVDTAIARPVIASVTDAVAGGATGELPNDGTGLTNDARPLVRGAAEPGSLVTIYRGTAAIGSALADAVTGAWSWQHAGADRFGEGAHVLTVKAVDAAGNTSTVSDSFTLTVDTTPPGAATIIAGIDNVGALTETILKDRVTDDTTPEFYGTADPLALVYLYDNDELIGSFLADKDGNWKWTLPELDPGQHNLSIATRDAAGNLTTTPDVYPFQVGKVWDFNDGTFNGWTILGNHTRPGDTFTRSTAGGGYQLEFITKTTGIDYSGDIMSIQIEVEAGKVYDFSFILSRITSYALLNPAQLALTVNGVPVSSYYTVQDTPQKVEGSWTAATSGTITLAINNLVSSGNGNDFWIDDIAIAPHEVAGPTVPLTSFSVVPDSIISYAEEQAIDNAADNVQMFELSLNDVLSHSYSPLFSDSENTEFTANDAEVDKLHLADIGVEEFTGDSWVTENPAAEREMTQHQLLNNAGIVNQLLNDQGHDDNLT